MRTGLLTLGFAALLPYLAWAQPASACTNDIDCPNAACGGEVCQWSAGDTVMTCVAAGTAAQGTDGWCATNADCKCMGEGATCAAPHCTFTLPKDGGTTGDASTTTTTDGGGTITADAGGTAETDAGGTATANPDAGSTGTTTGSDAAATEGEDAATSAPASSSKSGGCSIAATHASGTPAASLWGFAAIGLAFVARKRPRA